MTRVYLFKRFERFWHWTQAALIIFMGFTGFEIHGTYKVLGFAKAQNLHTSAAWALVGLWVLAIFWHFTTGEWKQYIPTTNKLLAMIGYYAVGVFQHAPKPFHQTPQRKHNPLQRLAYLFIKLLVNPLIWATGLLCLYYKSWPALGLTGVSLPVVAYLHTAAAFLMLMFFIIHIYFATMGQTPLAYIKAMITGWETQDETHGLNRAGE
jgi:thiosulfate reductase cytochrome b subunit